MRGFQSPLLSLFQGRSQIASSSSTAPTLVFIEETPLQSCAPLLSELAASAVERGEQVLLVTGEERPITSLLGRSLSNHERVHVARIEESVWSRSREAIEATQASTPTTLIFDSLDCLLDEVIDSADPARLVSRSVHKLLSSLKDSGSSRIVFVSSSPQRCLHPLLQSKLLTLLHSPQFLRSNKGTGSGVADSTGSASSGASLTIQLHPPAVWRHLLKQYGTGLRPPSTSPEAASRLRNLSRDGTTHSAVPPSAYRLQRRRPDAASTAEQTSSGPSQDIQARFGDDAKRSVDPRLWPILTQLSSESSTSPGQWFQEYADELRGDGIEAIRPTSMAHTQNQDIIAKTIALRDLLGPSQSGSSSSGGGGGRDNPASQRRDEGQEAHRHRTGWGIVTCKYRLPGGVYGEEIFGCVSQVETSATLSSDQARLRLVPLDMSDRRAVGAEVNKNTRKAGSVVDSLPFNLSLTDEQRARRDNVDLPFAPTDRIYEGLSREDPDAIRRALSRQSEAGSAYEEGEEVRLRRGTTGQSTIYFEPDSADEEDEEDPDEDLEL